jgi:chromosome segregation ATPase
MVRSLPRTLPNFLNVTCGPALVRKGAPLQPEALSSLGARLPGTMSSELEDLRQQLAALAARVDSIEGLRAMMDRDLADIRQRMDAQDHLLQALHITQANHTQRLSRIEEQLTRVEERLTRVEERLTRVEQALGRLDADFRGKLDTIVAMLDRLMPPAEGQA